MKDLEEAAKPPPPIVPKRLEHRFEAGSSKYKTDNDKVKLLFIESAILKAEAYTVEDFKGMEQEDMPGIWIDTPIQTEIIEE